MVDLLLLGGVISRAGAEAGFKGGAYALLELWYRPVVLCHSRLPPSQAHMSARKRRNASEPTWLRTVASWTKVCISSLWICTVRSIASSREHFSSLAINLGRSKSSSASLPIEYRSFKITLALPAKQNTRRTRRSANSKAGSS